MRLIAGKFNYSNRTNYWIDNDVYCQVGDYVLVENNGDYDLVKVVGIVETTEDFQQYIAGVKVSKKVIKRIFVD